MTSNSSLSASRARLEAGGIQIKFFGDSITHGMGSRGFVAYERSTPDGDFRIRGNGPDAPEAKEENYVVGTLLGKTDNRLWYTAPVSQGWCNLLGAHITQKFACRVSNCGMSGIASSHLEELCLPLVEAEDDLVFLMIGTNDRAQNPIEQYKENTSAFVRFLLSQGKQVVLLAPPPASKANEDLYPYSTKEVSETVEEIAKELSLPFLSIHGFLCSLCRERGVTIDSLLVDGLHPNDEGHRLIAEHMIRMLEI